jgi:hypothetical protein
VSRPTWLDYVLILFGVCVSVALTEMAGLRLVRGAATPPELPEPVRAVVPQALLLALGPILFWPVFHTTQRIAGRAQDITAAEWLLGLAWLGDLVLSGAIVWNHAGTLPELPVEVDYRHYLKAGYLAAVVGLGSLALLLWALDLVSRAPRPWTHRFALALLLWPAAPLGLMWACDLRIE